jgi:hypothetical protein
VKTRENEDKARSFSQREEAKLDLSANGRRSWRRRRRRKKKSGEARKRWLARGSFPESAIVSYVFPFLLTPDLLLIAIITAIFALRHLHR